MAKRKNETDGRSARRRQKDDDLLRRYSHLEYQLARHRRALRERVPVNYMKNEDGHRAAIQQGFVALSRWFNDLAPKRRDETREDIRRSLELGLSLRSKPASPPPGVPFTVGDTTAIIDDPLHPNGRCECGGEGRCDWCSKMIDQDLGVVR